MSRIRPSYTYDNNAYLDNATYLIDHVRMSSQVESCSKFSQMPRYDLSLSLSSIPLISAYLSISYLKQKKPIDELRFWQIIKYQILRNNFYIFFLLYRFFGYNSEETSISLNSCMSKECRTALQICFSSSKNLTIVYRTALLSLPFLFLFPSRDNVIGCIAVLMQ